MKELLLYFCNHYLNLILSITLFVYCIWIVMNRKYLNNWWIAWLIFDLVMGLVTLWFGLVGYFS
jgi:hypothetical protein